MTRLARLRTTLAEQPWELWTRQIAAVLRMDLRKNFLSRRGIWIYLLAFAPVVIITLHAIIDRHSGSMREDTEVLAGVSSPGYFAARSSKRVCITTSLRQ
ncbi:MAG: hypothetical protein DMG61_07175 [Acidobacteria bacterium]|nr:MAG: hypothetical protein DMG61_07175 [Acidobacteriota bacterium]